MLPRSSSLLLLVSFVAASCADERLTRREPRLELTIYTDGQAYASWDQETLRIDLGQVPVFATKWAIVALENPTQVPLKVDAVTYTSTTGERWGDGIWIDKEDVRRADRPLSLPGPKAPFVVAPFATTLLGIPYSPMLVGDHLAVVSISSNAANGTTREVTITGQAVFTGAPDLEVQFGTYLGPNPEDCADTDSDTLIDTCVVPETQALDVGNIGLGAQGTVPLILRNKAECAAFLGVDPCTLCALTLAPNPGRQNLGFGFKAGTNDAGLFNFFGNTPTPFDIYQRSISPECNEDGEERILVTFDAPETEGDFSTVIVIESNDPDEPLVEIPVRAGARNAPVAIAKLREIDPLNPTAPYTDPDDIQPLDRVYFDGRDSYDTEDPLNPALVAAYLWEVIAYPPGVNTNDFDPQGQNTGLFSFWVPLAGEYTVRLTVWNANGIRSGDTADARVEFLAVPGSRMHVQLTWDDPQNDQDLHLWYLPETDTLCEEPWDCYFGNKTPQWFDTEPATEGPNPRLDIDDTNGLGPENINIDDPVPSTYRIVVHYWSGHGTAAPTRNTVRVFLNGLQVAEYRRTLSEETMWEVADITWSTDGTGTVTPYPSDSPGQIGTVSPAPTSDCWGY